MAQYLQIIIWLCMFINPSISSIFGPPYPITTSLFNKRFSANEWNATLSEFKRQGGDTVWLKAPPLVRRTKEELHADPVFNSCTSGSSSAAKDCFEEAESEMSSYGLNILTFASYQNDENYGSSVLKCPLYDKKITTGNETYFRVVLPVTHSDYPCSLINGTSVVVLFTYFGGKDPQKLLIQSATTMNISVFLGVPAVPNSGKFDNELMLPYFEWVKRVVGDHTSRYIKHHPSSEIKTGADYIPLSKSKFKPLKGYYSSDECNIGFIDTTSEYPGLYRNLVDIIKKYRLKVAISPTIDLSRYSSNRTIQDHVNGFMRLLNTSVDVIAVHEGRGNGKGSYYWPTEIDQPIISVDPTLDAILNRTESNWKTNGTFRDAFTGSNHDLFSALGHALEQWKSKAGRKIDLWLIVEAYEELDDDACIIPSSKRITEVPLDRATKKRIDRALTHQAFAVNKVVSFSWDPDFTCATKSHNSSLADDIYQDRERPIIVDCFLHSPSNRSIVVIGVNLDGETQGFIAEWPDRDGKMHRATGVYGYYFELDYGIQHGLIPSIEYVQMFDPYNVIDLAEKGIITIQAIGSYYRCEFYYDFSNNKLT